VQALPGAHVPDFDEAAPGAGDHGVAVLGDGHGEGGAFRSILLLLAAAPLPLAAAALRVPDPDGAVAARARGARRAGGEEEHLRPVAHANALQGLRVRKLAAVEEQLRAGELCHRLDGLPQEEHHVRGL